MSTGNSSNKLWRRRDVIKLLGATAITGPVIFRGTTANAATSKVIKIGYVTSQTGVLAPVSEADPFILDQIRTALAEGITNGGVSYKVQIINKDSQSKTNRASAVAVGKETWANRLSILEAIVATDYPSIVGPIKWSGKPIKNVSKTPVVAGQWRKRDNGFELVICEDTSAPNIKAQDKLRLLN